MAKRVVVITCWGSHGDLFPYIGLALELKVRGHRPVLATHPGYRENIEREGIEFAAAGPLIDPNAPNARDLFERAMDPRKGSKMIVRELVMPKMRETYEELQQRRGRRGSPRDASSLHSRGPSIAEQQRIPWLSTVLAPLSFSPRTTRRCCRRRRA